MTASSKAPDMLRAAAQHIQDRAALRDTPEGERSMGKAVAAFNAIYGHQLTETQGWLFMVLLKQARSTSGQYLADDYEDMAAYAALAGESAASATQEPEEKKSLPYTADELSEAPVSYTDYLIRKGFLKYSSEETV